ncbi:MAG: metallophosphoesterase [Clostridia bacterium]|nr:metallophosphoesterase [Clostridia bacterium]
MSIPLPRHPLVFRPDGTFRVLMMSDLQESASYDPRSLRSVEVLLEEGDPDLVILGGDNCFGPEISSEEDLIRFLDIFTAPMERRGIPWAHVFGNHDHDVPISPDRHQALYERYPMCVSGHTDGIHGKSNFLLPVLNRRGEIALAVWGLDTNHTVDDLDCLVPGMRMRDAAGLPNRPVGYGEWGTLFFDQLLWYYSTSLALEREAGKKVPGLLCMHVAPFEYKTAQANPSCVREGHFDESLGSGPFNSGLFFLLLQRGDVRAVCCGHTHRNDFDADYCGIRLLWDACVGYRCYGVDERRGGRLFVYREDAPEEVTTSMIRTFGKV